MTFRRLIVLVALFAAGAGRAASAQAILVLVFGDKFASENLQGGIKVDLTWSTLSGLAGAERRRSFDVGGFIEFRLNPTFSIQPEFTFKAPAGAEGLPFAPTGDAGVDSLFATASDVSVTRTLGYVTFPILMKVTLGRLRLGAGPQASYVVRAFDRYTGTVSREDDMTYDVSLWPRVNKLEFGANILAEFALSGRRGLQSLRVRASWYRAFGDALTDAPGVNDVLALGLGIPIGGPRAAGPQ